MGFTFENGYIGGKLYPMQKKVIKLILVCLTCIALVTGIVLLVQAIG